MQTADKLHHVNFPNESEDYRKQRNALLDDEMELRRQIERVAARRRTLPAGGVLREDYVFETAAEHGSPTRVKLSELFTPGKDTLVIYSFMYGPERERPCPGCTHFLDALDGAAQHITQRMNLVVVAKSPLPRVLAFAKERGWRDLHLLSTAGNTYDRDYFGDSTALAAAVRKQQEFKSGEEWDMPMLNVFRREGGTIRHFWGSELLYVPPEPGQEYRHNDLLDPLWNLFDLAPEGRGDFEPKLSYTKSDPEKTTPHPLSDDMQMCIRECLNCYETCKREAMNHCLEAGGKHIEPTRFRLMISCAEICRTSADFMLGNSPLHAHTCAACAEVCEACAQSCEQIEGMEACAQACRRCAESCHKMASAGSVSGALQGSGHQTSRAPAKAPM